MRRVGRLAALLGQVIVDVAEDAVDVGAADAFGPGVAGQIGGQAVDIDRQTGKARRAAHILDQPARHETFHFGFITHDNCSQLFL